MKEEYVLYLDESEVKAKKFIIAGFAIKKRDIPVLEQLILEVKKCIWDEEYIKVNSPILHCTELNNVYVNRNREGKKENGLSDYFKVLNIKSGDEIDKIYKQVYCVLSKIIRTQGITVFSCIIDVKNLNSLFYIDEKHDGIHMIDDKYNIALQKIIENYTHFLSCVDGFGDVIYESRNCNGENSKNSPDIKLVNNYHQIHANNRGIMYTNNNTIQERNRVISTQNKYKDVAGLQLADFIAYNVLKFYTILETSQVTDFMKQVHRVTYNGGHKLEEKDQRAFWGMRIIPSFPQLYELDSSNKNLRNAYNNLKKERNKLKRQISELEDEVKKLKEEVGKNANNIEVPNSVKNE